jgi:thioredoxin 1
VKIYLILSLLAFGILSSCSKKAASSPSAHDLAAANFHSFIATPGTINIVDFSATWCPPCKQLKPVLSGIADENSATVKLGIIDVDQAKNLAAQQGVQGIPDVRFYINGKQVEKFTGAAPKQHIEQMISQLLSKHEQELKQNQGTETPPVSPEVATPIIQPNEAPHPDLVPQPPRTPAPTAPRTPTTPSTTPAPTTPVQPTIQPSKGNQLPPGMSKG